MLNLYVRLEHRFAPKGGTTTVIRRFSSLATTALLLALGVSGCGSPDPDGGARTEDGPTAEATTGNTAPDTALPSWCRDLPRPAYDTLNLAFVSDDGWFQVYRIRPGVHAIYEPHQFQEVISYLVEGDERALLVDTGMGIAPLRPVVERITDLPVTVVNTHTHPDHVGGNHEFDRVLAVDEEYTRRHAREGFDHGRMAGQVAPGALCRELPGSTDSASYRVRPFSITATVDDGETIELGGRGVEVIRTPGHTPDALALLDRDAGLLFTGDSFYEGPIYLFSEETDLESYTESVVRLAELAPRLELLLPGHNTPVAPPRRLVELREAIRAVRAGELEGRRDGGRVEYDLEHFSLLLAADDGG